jgi:hypothetical protein
MYLRFAFRRTAVQVLLFKFMSVLKRFLFEEKRSSKLYPSKMERLEYDELL